MPCFPFNSYFNKKLLSFFLKKGAEVDVEIYRTENKDRCCSNGALCVFSQLLMAFNLLIPLTMAFNANRSSSNVNKCLRLLEALLGAQCGV